MSGSNVVRDLTTKVRAELGRRLKDGQSGGQLGRVLSDLEDEQARRDRVDDELARAVDGVFGSIAGPGPASPFTSRPTPVGLDRRATMPRSLREPTVDEAKRGVAVVYDVSNFTVYKAINDRLRPGELFRMETPGRVYEIPIDEFGSAFASIARSKSYQQGSDSAPGTCRYVVGPPPPAAKAYLV